MTQRVAVVHDYLTQRGGAERVALAIWQAFPGARLATSVYASDATFPEFAEADVETSWLQKVPVLRRDPRLALPFLANAFDGLVLDDVDAVICSSSGWAHGVRTSAPKVVYCYNPARWLYQPEDYLRGQRAPVPQLLCALRPRLTRWDAAAAATAQRYIVTSTAVQRRVLDTYGIRADIVPPPVTVDVDGPQQPSSATEPGYFLVVGRPRGYKHTDVVCHAFAGLPDQRLVVVGGLPPGDWPSNLQGVVDVPDAELRWLYANCRALISVAHEDFGLTPVEANAFGKPALVLRSGGFLDTLVEGVTGWFVETVSAEAVATTVRQLLADPLDPAPIAAHAGTYNLAAFADALQRVVEDASAC